MIEKVRHRGFLVGIPTQKLGYTINSCALLSFRQRYLEMTRHEAHLSTQKTVTSLRIILEVELDKAICSPATRDETQYLAALTGVLSKSYPPLTTNMTLRFAEGTSPTQPAPTARIGAFEVPSKTEPKKT